MTQATTISEKAADTHSATLGGETVTFHAGNMKDVLDALVARHPGAGAPKIDDVGQYGSDRAFSFRVLSPLNAIDPATGRTVSTSKAVDFEPRSPSLAFSSFGAGKQVVDESARARIEEQHEALRANGVTVDTREQFFATGTRMAREGYGEQERRKAEHDAKLPLRDAAEQLRRTVLDEQREDVTLPASEIARRLTVNGKIAVDGLALTEQAIRGMLGRIESPALSYVLGLRERVANCARALQDKTIPAFTADEIRRVKGADVATLGTVLAHELRQAGDVEIKLRTRKGRGDVFAAVSPAYAPADAPEVLAEILDGMPADARASWAYDPSTTSWELRAAVWTPTPVSEQAVGEPFEGYVSFQSRDNGTSRLRGGGGILMLRCLNASTYAAGTSETARRHTGKILIDVAAMLAGATKAIDALCLAWGRAREAVVEAEEMAPIPIQKAIPGIYFGELFDRKSELAGVLPGRSADHVRGLSRAYFGERRDPERITRADIAQGWTRYVQGQPTPVRREAETAVASWLVSGKTRFDADRAASFEVEG